MKTLGIILVVIGFFSGWKLAAELTGWASLNTLTKDQVSVLLGVMWICIGLKKDKL